MLFGKALGVVAAVNEGEKASNDKSVKRHLLRKMVTVLSPLLLTFLQSENSAIEKSTEKDTIA